MTTVTSPTPAKRGRGRPKGFKNKNKLSSAPVKRGGGRHHESSAGTSASSSSTKFSFTKSRSTKSSSTKSSSTKGEESRSFDRPPTPHVGLNGENDYDMDGETDDGYGEEYDYGLMDWDFTDWRETQEVADQIIMQADTYRDNWTQTQRKRLALNFLSVAMAMQPDN
ncbi:hypothetical protein CF319_g8777 [Tilletia indica]|nr:hypothetical protein CF319_g8777 [Tilletia indica]